MTDGQTFGLHERAPEFVTLEHRGGEKMGVDVDQHGLSPGMAGDGCVGPCRDAVATRMSCGPRRDVRNARTARQCAARFAQLVQSVRSVRSTASGMRPMKPAAR